MTQPGETEGYDVLDHVNAILKHSTGDFLDYVIANTEEIPIDVLEKYIMDGSKPVLKGIHDQEVLNSKNIKLIGSNLIDIRKDYIRHDNIELSKLLMEIAKKEK
jgi:2-phospho-L-lactate transferase/gluconeogenesis factor (CofD/UPF0052 family)